MKRLFAVSILFTLLLMITACGSTKDKTSLIEFSNITMKVDAGSTIALGEAKNKDSKAHTILLKVSFYDKDKKLLDTADGTITNLAAGDTKTFETMSVKGDLSKADYKVQINAID